MRARAIRRSSLTLLVIASLISNAWAVPAPPARNKGCEYAKNDPCPCASTGTTAATATSAEESGGHTASYCQAMSLQDKGCSRTLMVIVGYVILTAICAVACFKIGYPWIIAIAETSCIIGSVLTALAEALAVYDLAKDAEKWTKHTSSTLASSWGLTGSAAGIVGAGVVAYMGPIKNMQSGATEAEKEANTNNASCIAVATNGGMAVMKGTNWVAYQLSNANLYGNMYEVMDEAPKPCAATTPIESTKAPDRRGGGPGPGSKDGPSPADLASPAFELGSSAAEFDAGFANGTVAEALASEAGSTKDKKEEIQKAFNGFAKTFGVRPSQIAESFARVGLGETVGKLLGDSEKGRRFAANFKQFDFKMRDTVARNYKFDANANLPRLKLPPSKALNVASGAAAGATLASGTKDVRFSGFAGDIWHAGSTQTIFEIVNERTRAVSDRVE